MKEIYEMKRAGVRPQSERYSVTQRRQRAPDRTGRSPDTSRKPASSRARKPRQTSQPAIYNEPQKGEDMKKTRSRDLLYSRHLATSTVLAVIAAALLFTGCTTRQHQETLTEEPERPGAAQTTIPLPTMQPAYRTGGPLLALKNQELAASALAKSTSSKIEPGEISLPAKPVTEASQPHSPRSEQPVASEEAAPKGQ